MWLAKRNRSTIIFNDNDVNIVKAYIYYVLLRRTVCILYTLEADIQSISHVRLVSIIFYSLQ